MFQLIKKHLWILCALSLIACDERTDSNGDPSVNDMTQETDGDLGVAERSLDLEMPDHELADAHVPTELDEGPPVPQIPPPLDLPCNDAASALGDGITYTTLAWDDGEGLGTVADQTWEIVGRSITDPPLFEVVRFEIPHPAKIHQISVQFGTLPPERDTPLTLGIYGDFGYNGFDFWSREALWTGHRCRGDHRPGEWLTFTLDEPITLAHPGLIYVGHQRLTFDAPALFFDATPPEGCDLAEGNCCNSFDACRSSWTFPDIENFEGTPFWSGLATTFPYDYLVRLTVEYTEEVTADEMHFRPVEGLEVGGRIAWGDFDDDGDEDLLLGGPRLYRNTEGTFEEITADSGLIGAPGSGGTWGDYDNDGCLDLILFAESTTQSDALMRGDCEGRFTDVTERSGITDLLSDRFCQDESENRAPSAAAGWVDLDADGLLDLYMPNFFCWPAEKAYIDHVWRNVGDGTFEPWTGLHGFEGEMSTPLSSRGVNPIDYEQDGDMDIFVNNYRLHANRFYRNLGAGMFEESAEAVNLAGHPYRLGLSDSYGHSIGAAWGDLDGDGAFDLVVANLAHPRFFNFSDKTQVLIQRSLGIFEDLQNRELTPEGGAGIRYQETHSVPVLGDFNQDGILDLVISSTYDGRPTDFYWGLGDGTFTLDQYHSGITTENGWGMAAADYDGDGDLDLVTSNQLYQNQMNLRGDDSANPESAWLQLRLVGDIQSNRAAIGATAKVIVGDRVYLRSVEGSSAQGNQNALTLHFGLGVHDQVDRIEVRYIGGGLVEYEGPFEVNQRLKLFESGTVESMSAR